MWRAKSWLATAALVVSAAGACRGDGGHPRGRAGGAPAAQAGGDAAVVDAAAIDAVPVDAPVDAPPYDLVPEIEGAAGEVVDAHAMTAATSVGGETLTLVPVGFDALPDWADDHHAEAVPSFLASCERLATLGDDEPIGQAPYGGRARAWRHACAAAAALPPHDDAAARAFFETEFAAYEADGKHGPVGKMTGYYVESLRGSRTRHDAYQYPIYARPADLEMVDLTSQGVRGRRIWGHRDPETHKLVPHFTRAEIRQGALDGQGLELVYTDDRIDALFLEIEGSGRMTLDDGTEIWLQFDGKNGRPYHGVGRVLSDLGEIHHGQGSMQGIRAWLAAHPDRFDEIADQNEAKVFFKIGTHHGAWGSQSVVLTPGRSLAIDRAFVAQSTPVWVDTRAPVRPGGRAGPWRHLVIAQDTGGGILGPVRGDIYFGADDLAGEVAGRTGGPGRYWLLLPRTLHLRSAAH